MREKKKHTGFLIIMALCFILLLALTVFMESLKGKGGAEYKRAKSAFSQIQERENQIQQVKKKRIELYKKVLLLDQPHTLSYRTADFIRKLSLINYSALQMNQCEMRWKQGGIHFKLQGYFRGTSEEQLNSLLEEFTDRLGEIASPASLETSKSYLSQSSRMEFNIGGEVEL